MSDTRTKITADIVSVKREDKPLIYISEEAIYLKQNNDKLKSQLQQKENIIKEVREYIADRVAPDVNDYNIEFRLKLNTTVDEFIRHLSEILDKGE